MRRLKAKGLNRIQGRAADARPRATAKRASHRKPRPCRVSERKRFFAFDTVTGWYLSSRPYADGCDKKGEENTLSRRSGARSFLSREEAIEAILSIGCGRDFRFPFHNFVVVGEGEDEPQRDPFEMTEEPFPKSLTLKMLEGFVTTTNGWTKPRIGRINGEGALFIAKFASHTSIKHVTNECLTHRLYRYCGLSAPRSRLYEIRSRSGKLVETVLLSEYVEGKPLKDYLLGATEDELRGIGKKVLETFPLDSFVNNYDAYNNDNSLVDKDGNLWHVDNGSSLRFRATGGVMPWTKERTDPLDAMNGIYCMYNGDCRLKSPQLAKALSKMEKDEIERCWEAFGFKFRGLVKWCIPSEYRSPHLCKYAQDLDNLITKKHGRIEVPAVVESAYRGEDAEWQRPIRDEGYYDDFKW